MPAKILSFPLTRPQLEVRRAQLAQAGVVFAGDHGTLSHSGVTLQLDYLAQFDMLEIRVVDKPWIVPEVMVEEKIRGWFG